MPDGKPWERDWGSADISGIKPWDRHWGKTPAPLQPAPKKPDGPDFFAGMAESIGGPRARTWQQSAIQAGYKAADDIRSAYHHPVEAAEDTAKMAQAVTKFAYKHPGEFLKAMVNVPQIKQAYRDGNYAEVAGLLVGTVGQTATAFFTGEGIIPKAARLTQTIAVGGTIKDFVASEAALKASRAAEKAKELDTLAHSVKLKVTPGERLAGGKFEAAERGLRGFPGIAGPYRKIADERKNAILAIRDSLAGETSAMKASAQNLYNAIGKRVPNFTAIQDQIVQLRSAQRKARDPKLAYDIGIQLEQEQARAEALVAKSGDPVAVSAWHHADSLWRRYHAKLDLHDVIEHNVIGFTADELGKFGKTAEATRPQGLNSLVADLKKLDADGTLNDALGAERATQLKRVASLYDRVRQTGKGYLAERLLGYGIIGALPFLPKGYVFDVAAGAAGGMMMSWAMMKGGSTTEVFENFLRAAERGDMAQASSLARSLAQHAEMIQRTEASKKASKPPVTPMPPMSDAERLRISVPIGMQPGPGEDPMRDMLSRLLDELTQPTSELSQQQLQSEMESAATKKRSRFRESEAVREARRR